MKGGGPKCDFERSIMILGPYVLVVPLPAVKFPLLLVSEYRTHAHNELAPGALGTRIPNGVLQQRETHLQALL